jgi:exosortase family protein XrtF
MMQSLKHPVVRFLVIGALLYFLWLLLYYFFIKVYTDWDYYLDFSIVYFAQQLLDVFGYVTMIEIESDHVILMLDHTTNTGVWVGDECNGFKLFSIFAIFIIAFPGSWKTKAWFIPLGLLLIHIANIIRVCALLLIYEQYPTSLDFNHLYTFTIFVYSIIFLLWWWWAKKYGRVSKN